MTKKELFATYDLSPLWMSSIENVYPNDDDIIPESTLKLLGIEPRKEKKNDNIVESIKEFIKIINPESVNPLVECKDDVYYHSFEEDGSVTNLKFSIKDGFINCKLEFIEEEKPKQSNEASEAVKAALKDIKNALESGMPIITPKIFKNEKVVTDFIEEYNRITYEIDDVKESLIGFIEEMTDK